MTIRTDSENAKFKDLIESAVDKIDQAISDITYLPYGQTQANAALIDTLDKLRDRLDIQTEQVIYKP